MLEKKIRRYKAMDCTGKWCERDSWELQSSC